MSGKEIKIQAAGFIYRVLIEKGSLSDTGKNLRLLFPSNTALLVSDTKVYSLYGDKVLKSLAAENWQVKTINIRPGERSKSVSGAARLYNATLDAGLERNSPVIALGGGVVGDIAGFLAATYMRGVPLVMLPTTLLAQVDSSVGGKVAVNHPRGKNLIGSIYPPRLVMIDPQVLKTLPARQLKAGLAEVIKYGMIVNGDFFTWLEQFLPSLLQGDNSMLDRVIATSVQAKASVVEQDEHEKDYRRILNFGHTIGHALEASTAYRHYLHGEAVLAGIASAIYLAEALKILGQDDADRMKNMIGLIGLKKAPADLTVNQVIDKLRQDKKRLNDELIFVLPSAIGRAVFTPVKDLELIKKAIRLCLV